MRAVARQARQVGVAILEDRRTILEALSEVAIAAVAVFLVVGKALLGQSSDQTTSTMPFLSHFTNTRLYSVLPS